MKFTFFEKQVCEGLVKDQRDDIPKPLQNDEEINNKIIDQKKLLLDFQKGRFDTRLRVLFLFNLTIKFNSKL